MDWVEAARWWLPTIMVAVVAATAFAAALGQTARPARKYWMAGVLAVAAVALAASAWQQSGSRLALTTETARLRALAGRLDELGHMLPAGPGKTPGETFDTVAAAIRSLNAKIADLEKQIAALQQQTRHRTIDLSTALKMADYLRQFGSRRVVVSCLPDDIEAYDYANRIATVLRAAGWEAQGPEKTTIFGTAPAMGVRLFVHSGTEPPDTANLLAGAFGRFNIPFTSGVTPSEAIPDPGTVEVFVSKKP
jgi:hypothetical protein